MAQQWRLICGTVSCGTTFAEGLSDEREAMERVSFAAVRKAEGENRGAEILFSQAKPA